MCELKVDSSSEGEGSGVAVGMPSQNLTASSLCLGVRATVRQAQRTLPSRVAPRTAR